MFVIEAFLKIIENIPVNKEYDKCFYSVHNIVNYLFGTRILEGVYVDNNPSYFQIFKCKYYDLPLTSDNEKYASYYYRNYIIERSEDPDIINISLRCFPNKWKRDRLMNMGFLGELPLGKIFSKFSLTLLKSLIA